MKKSKCEEYWQKRTVKAEEALMTIRSIADANEYERIGEIVKVYFESVAAGQVKDVSLGDKQP